MSLVSFNQSSINQLRALLGSYSNDQVGRLIKSSAPYIESRWYKVTAEVEVEEGELKEYKAKEIKANGDIVENGVFFDSDGTNTNKVNDPTYKPNLKLNESIFTGSVEVGKSYQVESYYPNTYNEEIEYYIIPKGGGGGTAYVRVRLPNGASTAYNGVTGATVEVLDDSDNVINTVSNVVQRKYSTAIIYENEIMLGEINGDICDVTISMSGIGVGDWISA